MLYMTCDGHHYKSMKKIGVTKHGPAAYNIKIHLYPFSKVALLKITTNTRKDSFLEDWLLAASQLGYKVSDEKTHQKNEVKRIIPNLSGKALAEFRCARANTEGTICIEVSGDEVVSSAEQQEEFSHFVFSPVNYRYLNLFSHPNQSIETNSGPWSPGGLAG